MFTRPTWKTISLVILTCVVAATASTSPALALSGRDSGAAIVNAQGGNGYSVISEAAGSYEYGGAVHTGSLAGQPLNRPIVDADRFPNSNAKIFVAADGGAFLFGSPFHGSAANLKLNAEVTAVIAGPGGSYALIAQDGGVFTYGGYAFPGSLADRRLPAPIVDAAPTPDYKGMWLLGADGAVYSLGNAPSMSFGVRQLNQPMTALLASPSGRGLLAVARDGGTFATGDYPFQGSFARLKLNAPVVGAAQFAGTAGTWLVAADGGILTLRAPFYGAATNEANTAPLFPGRPLDGSSGGRVRVPCPGRGSIEVATSIAKGLKNLLAAASSAGHNLCGGGYRSPQRQIELRAQNCGRDSYSIYSKPSGQCRPPTARPGNSRHELGLAVDFTIKGSIVRSGSAASGWLRANASRYGLKNFPKEAWHYSDNGR